MILCPRGCTGNFIDELELYRHLRDRHRLPDYESRRLAGVGAGTDGDVTGRLPGWYEGQVETPTGKKALEHSIAATKAQMASMHTLTTVPYMPKVKPSVQIQEGWKKTPAGYSYERRVIEEHTTENVLTRIMRGEIVGDHGSLTLWTYDKDIGHLSEEQDRARILEAKLVAYTPSQPEFVTVGNELHFLKKKIEKEKQEITPAKFQEPMLEDTYRGDDALGEGDYEKWVSEFMQEANKATESVIERLKKKDPITLK